MTTSGERHGTRRGRHRFGGPTAWRTAVLLAWAATALPAAADGPPVRATEFMRLRTVPAIEVSRDGRHAVVVVRSMAPDEWAGDDVTYQYRSHLWLVPLVDEGGAPRQLTFGDARDSEPALSSDGRRIAFVRTPQSTLQPTGQPTSQAPGQAAGGGGSGNIWTMPVDGGEARQVTFLRNGATSPAWSPDGRAVALVSPVPLTDLDTAPLWPQERPGRRWNDEPFTGAKDAPPAPANPSPLGDADSQRAWLARNAARDNPAVITRLDFQGETALRGGFVFDQIFVVDPDAPRSEGGSGARRVTHDAAPHRGPRFVEDGRRLVYSVLRPTTAHLDDTQESELWSVDLAGREPRLLLAQPGWTFEDPKPSPDGGLIGFRGRQSDEPAFRQWMVGLVATPPGLASATPAHPAQPIWLTGALDRSVERWSWWSGTPRQGGSVGAGVILTAASEGGIPLLALTEGLAAPTPLCAVADGQPAGVYAFGAGAGTILYARTTPRQPCVLVQRDGRGDREILDLNPWTAQRTLSMPEMRWIERTERGREPSWRVQLFAMPPATRPAGRRVPTVVAIHGGPAGMWGPGELGMWHEFQWLCGRGWGVVYCNPRGSGGYGEEFQRGNRQDWGPGPASDVLAAVDAARALEWVDPDRLVVMGGSYGAYLTAFIVTRDDRFKAAVADRGVYDLATFFGEGNAWRLVQWTFGGTPFDPRFQQPFERNSIFRALPRVKTPLLIMHGSSDLRTGVAQSEMLYRALRVLGKAVEYVRYPAADHDLSRRGDARQRIDRLLRGMEFFERFVR